MFEFKGLEIELVNKVGLLGLVLRNNLSWSSNTESIFESCDKILWFLRKLKRSM